MGAMRKLIINSSRRNHRDDAAHADVQSPSMSPGKLRLQLLPLPQHHSFTFFLLPLRKRKVKHNHRAGGVLRFPQPPSAALLRPTGDQQARAPQPQQR
jgi:hypothetical protein